MDLFNILKVDAYRAHHPKCAYCEHFSKASYINLCNLCTAKQVPVCKLYDIRECELFSAKPYKPDWGVEPEDLRTQIQTPYHNYAKEIDK